ncbi:MAG: SDR family NAD(P)-dependent oxidoreductase [Spirosomaceae bacterium]|nr:SDR family NAD(P)-dependent oxidoreductase [Spirosomataceae bacterium]
MKIIIVGATSGIGKSIAEHYISKNHTVGITGRRTEKLSEIKSNSTNTEIYAAFMDVANTEESRMGLAALVEQMGGCDVLIINAGVGFPKATYEQEMQVVDINARGFMALANWGFEYFKTQKKGHLVGISSVAATRSSPYAPEYHATKAFMSSYLQGLRYRSAKWYKNIHVTDIRPGFVETAMTEENKTMFWVATPQKAARQIAEAIESKKAVAYVTKRYVLIAWLMKLMPDWIYTKVM